MSVIGFPVSIENAHCSYMLYVSASNVGKKSMSELRSSYLQELTQNYKKGLAKRRAEMLEAKRNAEKEKQETTIETPDIRQEEQSVPTHDSVELHKSEITSTSPAKELSWDYFDGFDSNFSEEVDSEGYERGKEGSVPEALDDSPMESTNSLDFLNLVAARKQSSEYTDKGKLITDCRVIEKIASVINPVVPDVMYVSTGKSILNCVVIEKSSPVQETFISKPIDDVEYVSYGKLITSCKVIHKPEDSLIEEVPEEAVEIRPVEKNSVESLKSSESIDTSRQLRPKQSSDLAAVKIEGSKNKIMPQSKPEVKNSYEFSELTEKNIKEFVRGHKGCSMIDIIHAFGNFPEAKVKEIILAAKRHNKIQVKHDQYYL